MMGEQDFLFSKNVSSVSRSRYVMGGGSQKGQRECSFFFLVWVEVVAKKNPTSDKGRECIFLNFFFWKAPGGPLANPHDMLVAQRPC